MKILVVSDTHFQLQKFKMVLKLFEKEIDMILHMGDHCADAIEIQKLYPEIPVHFVKGNCDFDKGVPREKIIEIQNKKILLTHGDLYDVKYGYEEIGYAAEAKQVDVALFGHSHVPLIQYHGDILLMNPGSLTYPRGGSGPTFGLLEIHDSGEITPQILDFA